MKRLKMIKEYITTSFHTKKEDFNLTPFDSKGGLGKMWKLFGNQIEEILDHLNEDLTE